MRAGFIGTGGFATAHARSLKRIGVEVTACFGTNPEKTERFAEEFSCQRLADPSVVISKDSIDVLYLVVPPFALDGSWEKRAIAQGIPFLCEKPVALNTATAFDVARRVEDRGLVTASGFLLRQGETSARVCEVIGRNRISIVRASRMQTIGGKPWHRRMDQSGGPMVESGIHTIDYMRWVLGELACVRAVALSGINARRYPGCDVYDSIDAQLRFAGGSVGEFAMTTLAPPEGSRMEFLDVYGEDFVLTFVSPWDGGAVRYKEGSSPWTELTIDKARHDLHNREFVEAAASGKPDRVRGSYPDAARSLAAVLAINQSIATGDWVEPASP